MERTERRRIDWLSLQQLEDKIIVRSTIKINNVMVDKIINTEKYDLSNWRIRS